MARTVKKDIEKRYRKISERYKGKTDKVFSYVCDRCGQVTKVRQVDEGIAPMGIECPYCHDNAFCYDEGDKNPNIPVGYEWYRPALNEVQQMVDERMFTVNFILSGGLLRREIC